MKVNNPHWWFRLFLAGVIIILFVLLIGRAIDHETCRTYHSDGTAYNVCTEEEKEVPW